LAIYAVAVVFTIGWLRAMLMSTMIVDGGSVRAFESTSQRFGRWTLGWTLFLSAIMFVLGCLGLLPNQNWRTTYAKKGTIFCEAVSATTRVGRSSGESQKLMDSWITWIDERVKADPTTRF